MSFLTDLLVSAGIGSATGRASASAVSKAPIAVLVVVVILEIVFVALAVATGTPIYQDGSNALAKIPTILVGLLLAIVTGLAVLGTGHGVAGIVGGLLLAASTFCAALDSSTTLSAEIFFFILMAIPLVKRVLDASGISLGRK